MPEGFESIVADRETMLCGFESIFSAPETMVAGFGSIFSATAGLTVMPGDEGAHFEVLGGAAKRGVSLASGGGGAMRGMRA